MSDWKPVTDGFRVCFINRFTKKKRDVILQIVQKGNEQAMIAICGRGVVGGGVYVGVVEPETAKKIAVRIFGKGADE